MTDQNQSSTVLLVLFVLTLIAGAAFAGYKYGYSEGQDDLPERAQLDYEVTIPTYR